tara:strand:- start:3839 stop:4264 length:426 start_codon:yes stop_codon:yes gene_type:complete
MEFSFKFDNRFKQQKILDVDFGPVFIIEPKYYPNAETGDSLWTKLPLYPIMLDNFMENCVKCGGGILFDNNKVDNHASCVFRYVLFLPYNTKEITFKGIGSPLNDVPLNIKPYLNKLKKEWAEKLPYRPLEWKTWKPIVLR